MHYSTVTCLLSDELIHLLCAQGLDSLSKKGILTS